MGGTAVTRCGQAGKAAGPARQPGTAGALALLVLAALAAACEPDRPQRARPEPASVGGGAEAGEVPVVEPIAYQVFNEEPASFAPGRLTLHVLVPADATDEQIRQMLVKLLTQRGESDTTLLGLRAIAYRPVARSSREADLLPAAWAEWLPPEGWVDATPASRARIHRVYTYFGAEPEW